MRRNSLHRIVGLECKLCCDVAVNHAILTYCSLENISKCIISQNNKNLDQADGVCMYYLTNWVSGFACGDHADC